MSKIPGASPLKAGNSRVPGVTPCVTRLKAGHSVNALTDPHGRGCGVGRGLGVTLGAGVGDTVGVGVGVGVTPLHNPFTVMV